MIRNFGPNDLLLFLHGFQITLGLTVAAFVGSAILGFLLLLSLTSRNVVLKGLSTAWIQAIQGIPLLGMLFLIFFGFALWSIDVSKWVAAAVALSLYGSAYLSEIWRGAVAAVPKGQWESSGALGLTGWQQVRYVVYPQAFRIAIPPTIGFLVQLIKNTSLASVIGVEELTRQAALINGATFMPFLVYGLLCLFYFVVCFALSSFSRVLERRLKLAW